MSQRLLRHKPSGVLYVYQEVFASRDDFEEIIDVEATEVETVVVKPGRPKKVTEPAIRTLNDEALSADASRGLP